MGFILGLAVGLLVGAVSMAAMVGFGSSENWAIWAQTCVTASVATAALYLPVELDRRARKRSKDANNLKAKAFAQAIHLELLEIDAKGRGMVRSINADTSSVKRRVQSDGELSNWKFHVDGALSRCFDYADIFPGDLGPTLIQLWGAAAQFNRMVDSVDKKGSEFIPKALIPQLQITLTLKSQAEVEIVKIHDAQVPRED